MYIMPKKKTKVSNVNTNVNNIHVNIHNKKKKSKASKSKSSVQPLPNIINVSLQQPPSIPHFLNNNPILPRDEQPVRNMPRAVFQEVNPLNTVGFTQMETQTDPVESSPTVDEIEIDRLRKLDQKRVDNNERRRQKRKTEKSIHDPDYKFDDL